MLLLATNYKEFAQVLLSRTGHFKSPSTILAESLIPIQSPLQPLILAIIEQAACNIQQAATCEMCPSSALPTPSIAGSFVQFMQECAKDS
jgi:hypothetical protein